MNKVLSLLFFCICCFYGSVAQQLPATPTDTVRANNSFEVVIKAYEQNRKLVDVAGAVNYVERELLERYSNTSIVNALNATSGVRMEERSPGSYRLNIRGSSLRSPFGVRNVKIYYNSIPFTDPGGNTYLNQLGFYNIGSLEIIKGPGSSVYGAGTGGVMLIESSPFQRQPAVTLSQSVGSYGTSSSNLNLNTGTDTFRNVINFQHQQSDGYRQQSALRRDVFSWHVSARVNKDILTATFLYADLTYQTPGALTLAEYQKDPAAARPRAGASPGAREANAAIFQKMFLAGISYQKNISTDWQNTTTLYGAFSKLDNPAIRNYARNNQPHTGGRTVFQFKKNIGQSVVTWHTGAEMQQSFNTANVYNNKGGSPDSLQTSDEIRQNTYFVFTQLGYEYRSWSITAGASLNASKLSFSRLSPTPSTGYSLRFTNQLTPRIAVLRKLTNTISAYASWSKGFSPPTTDELFPTGSLANPTLSAEQGQNFEIGSKGYLFKNRLSYDVSAFYYKLRNSIVQRRDAAGGDYYLNAGGTNQRGLESQLRYQLARERPRGLDAAIWVTHTFYDFYYRDFKQLVSDFSGNRLPGAPKNSLTAGLDAHLPVGIYTNLTWQYNSRIPLNDANTAFADPYHLLSIRAGYKKSFGRFFGEIYSGVENLTNATYSLGNDINGFGGRYYNTAPRRSYFAGINISYALKK